MNEPTNAMSVENLKTARDFVKLYVRANPDSIRDKDPGTLLEIHKAFLDGLTSQAKELTGPDGQPIMITASKWWPEKPEPPLAVEETLVIPSTPAPSRVLPAPDPTGKADDLRKAR